VKIMNRDLVAAGIPKVDADGCVVHVHALRHSFGTHLSKAGVAPRVAQAAMRHSNISLTMGTYTDARLLDTAEAVERLHLLTDSGNGSNGDLSRNTRPETSETVSSLVAPMVAPNVGNRGHFVSLPDQVTTTTPTGQKTKRPGDSLELPGFVGWALRDSNPRPSRWKRDALTN